MATNSPEIAESERTFEDSESDENSEGEEMEEKVKVVRKFFEDDEWKRMTPYLKGQKAQMFENWTFMKEIAGYLLVLKTQKGQKNVLFF